MTTFLQYLCETLLGPPLYDHGDGHADWDCPFCGKAGKFHTRPAHPHYKDRFDCWVCNSWGDEADLLRHFHPGDDYDRRLRRLASLQDEYNALPESSPPVLLPGSGSTKPKVDRHQLDAAWADATEEERKVLQAAWEVAQRTGVDVAALCEYQAEFNRWIEETNQEHMEGCKDPECDWYCCRLARGWTRERIREDVERNPAKHLQRLRERV